MTSLTNLQAKRHPRSVINEFTPNHAKISSDLSFLKADERTCENKFVEQGSSLIEWTCAN